MDRHRLCLFGLLLLSLTGNAFAERYAILVGVSQYKNDGVNGVELNLKGPDQDVAALRSALITSQGFADKNILTLLDQAATRRSILDALSGRVREMKDGDYLLFYFSGHGTSAFDKDMKLVSSFIGPNSGALAPHDLPIDSPENIAASLIIGRRDLRPLLEGLPKGSEALVILDACYSENSVKAIQPRLRGRVRGITLGNLLPPTKGTPGGGKRTSGGDPTTLNAEPDRSYPYANVIALTAASKDEAAVDVDERSMVAGRFPTVDGKPHGAFTNSLLEALAGAGDLNHDGHITFEELHEFTRQSVQAHYAQTPQLLAPLTGTAISAPAFAIAAAKPKPTVESPCKAAAGSAGNPAPEANAKLRVRLEDASEDLRKQLIQISGIEITEKGADLVIHSSSTGFEIYDATGALVRRFQSGEAAQLVQRVAAEPALREFVAFGYECQTFSASLRLSPEGQARFSQKEQMKVEGWLDRPAYLVLFDIDQTGAVSIVYPVKPGERDKKSPGTIPLGTLRATAPFGSEYLKLVAFSEEPPLDLLGCKSIGNGNLSCPEVEPHSPKFEDLRKFLQKAAAGTAESRIRFITYEE
jgi:hypothetical protein